MFYKKEMKILWDLVWDLGAIVAQLMLDANGAHQAKSNQMFLCGVASDSVFTRYLALF